MAAPLGPMPERIHKGLSSSALATTTSPRSRTTSCCPGAPSVQLCVCGKGYDTEGASESFDGRLGQERVGSRGRRGRKCVRVTDYARLLKQSGIRAETKSSRGGDAVGGGGVARDRVAERLARRGRSQESQRRGRHGGRDRHRRPKRSRSPAPSRGASSSIRGGRSKVNRKGGEQFGSDSSQSREGVSCSWRR
jgi:hypothetical protein